MSWPLKFTKLESLNFYLTEEHPKERIARFQWHVWGSLEKKVLRTPVLTHFIWLYKNWELHSHRFIKLPISDKVTYRIDDCWMSFQNVHQLLRIVGHVLRVTFGHLGQEHDQLLQIFVEFAWNTIDWLTQTNSCTDKIKIDQWGV